MLASQPSFEPSSTSGELSTLPTPHIVQLIKASTDQLEKRITIVEKSNQELKQHAKQLQEVFCKF
jgi:hypothetical protein